MEETVTNKRHPALDGLRAVAVIAVIIGHARLNPQFQWVAVLLFFTLSGYLITDILLREKERGASFLGYWRWFTLRRILRIFPAYFFLIFVATFVLYITKQPTSSIPWHVFYLQNLAMLSSSWDGPEWLSHTWSLAIEEQFYLLWPFVVWLAGRRYLPHVCAAIMAGAFFWRFDHVRPWMEAHFHTIAVVDCLVWGAILACIRQKAGDIFVPKPVRYAVWTMVIATLVMIPIDADKLSRITAQYAINPANPYLVTVMGGLFALIIAICIEHPPRILCIGPLRHIGKISYGLYLWHYPIIILFTNAKPDHLLLVILEIGAAYIAAVLSWHIIEAPANALKNRRVQQA